MAAERHLEVRTPGVSRAGFFTAAVFSGAMAIIVALSAFLITFPITPYIVICTVNATHCMHTGSVNGVSVTDLEYSFIIPLWSVAVIILGSRVFTGALDFAKMFLGLAHRCLYGKCTRIDKSVVGSSLRLLFYALVLGFLVLPPAMVIGAVAETGCGCVTVSGEMIGLVQTLLELLGVASMALLASVLAFFLAGRLGLGEACRGCRST